jgi:hypothetical protein
MSRTRRTPTVAVVLLLAGSLMASSPAAAEDAYQDTGTSSTVSYEPSSEVIANPERGFYHHTETHYRADGSGYNPLNVETLRRYRDEEQITQILRVFYLEKFATLDRLDADWLDLVAADFAAAREAGVSVIVRFAYAQPQDSFPYMPPYGDAPVERVVTHIEQLAPVLRANADVIATVQSGFVGLWGEGYYTDHFVADPLNPGVVTEEDWANRRAVVLALLDALPSEGTVQLRTMRMKQRIFDRPSGTAGALTADEAFTESDIARVGHHNDCFLASPDDFGTFLSDPISLDQDYLAQETRYVPMGGETCNVNPPRSEWPTASAEMERYHYSYLNIDYNRSVLNSWGEDNLDEVRRRLGYRVSLTEGTFDDGVRPGRSFGVDFTVVNDGWAAPYNSRPARLILHGERSTFAVSLDTDIRRWSGGSATDIQALICTRGMPPGAYRLYLDLPAGDSSLAGRPEYSIRLANEDTWVEDRGWNDLGHSVTVSPRITAGGSCEGAARPVRLSAGDNGLVIGPDGA